MIKLINGYVIDADVRQYRLRRLYEDGSVDESVPFTYYRTFPAALKGAYRIMGRNRLQKGDYTLKESIELLTELEDRFEKILEDLKGSHESLSFSESELGREFHNFEYDDGMEQALF